MPKAMDAIAATLLPTVTGAADSLQFHASEGLVPYTEAVAAMEARVDAIRAGAARECLWFLEHAPLYTAGTSAKDADLLEPARLPVYRTGRGGKHTYHGPGQRVAYVMLDLQRPGAPGGADIRRHVHNLEEWIIRTLARLGVRGERRAGRVGIWVARGPKEDKIAAIGVRVRKWVSYHGISLNVAPDLSHYSGIVPCGIGDHGVTSLKDLGVSMPMKDADVVLREEFMDVFGRN